jgi:hypothetical protein
LFTPKALKFPRANFLFFVRKAKKDFSKTKKGRFASPEPFYGALGGVYKTSELCKILHFYRGGDIIAY